MQKEITNIIQENKRRNDTLFPEYDPLTGQGSPIERFKFRVSKNSFIMLPNSLLDIPQINAIHKKGGLHKIKATQKEIDKFYIDLYKLRQKHDFEYWAYCNIKIQHKETGLYVNFKLRAAQRKLLEKLEKMRLNNEPIRLILLKARQWGGSTLIQLYMMWIQTQHMKNWNSVIGTEVIPQAENIKNMYEIACENYPSNVGTLTMRPFGKGNARLIVERGCKIFLGSMERPNSLRSGNYAMAHFSEVALWKATKMKKPQDVISSVFMPNTCAIVEMLAYEISSKPFSSLAYFCLLQLIFSAICSCVKPLDSRKLLILAPKISFILTRPFNLILP